MSSQVVQTRYPVLEEISQRFDQQAESTSELRSRLAKNVDVIAADAWVGRGAQAFVTEMQNDVLPAIQRLQAALGVGGQMARQIGEVIKQAEEAAAAPFKTVGAMDGASVLGVSTTDASETATGPNSSGPYQVGGPTRPEINHDTGFLARYPPREPTLADHAKLAYWRGKLEAAEALRPDLVDATAAYRHFLDGEGQDRQIDYERYLTGDPSGETAMRNIIADAQRHAEVIGQGRSRFNLTSEAYAIGGSDARFPYPQSENWQKAIGGHQVWTSADVQVTGDPPNRTYTMMLTLHMEDRYNFNPGQSDIATGIPDSANGIFEITGLAQQYMNRGEVTRVVSWGEGSTETTIVDQDPGRNRRPADNRRFRNRI